MFPRYFRATAFLCLAVALADLVVSQLPHQHSHDCIECASASCEHSHGCSHAHHATKTCSHQHGCGHQHEQPAPAQESPQRPANDPCDHCTICQHHAQAALLCTSVPLPACEGICQSLSDLHVAQIAAITPHVYQGRGPPAWL